MCERVVCYNVVCERVMCYNVVFEVCVWKELRAKEMCVAAL